MIYVIIMTIYFSYTLLLSFSIYMMYKIDTIELLNTNNITSSNNTFFVKNYTQYHVFYKQRYYIDDKAI